MQKLYLKTAGGKERINIDVYKPQSTDSQSNVDRRPAIIIVCGGGGKDARTGSPLVGKHAAGYHDLGEALSRAGFWGIIPSRRGDPQRTTDLQANLAAQFRLRLPEALLQDEGPNDGVHSHRQHVAELTWLVENLDSIFGAELDTGRIGIIGKSAGGGVALAVAAESGKRITSVALWGSALKTSQWFAGPKADSFFQEVLDKRGVHYHRETFLQEMCDSIDFVGQVESPTLFACSMSDPYAPVPPEPDKWSSVSEQIELMRYATRCRYAKVVGLKGAEHTMYAEQPMWRAYASTLTQWFDETLVRAETCDSRAQANKV
ncbi:MAG: hypothetical protein L0Z50_27085 [Verrucomicrobiales bacterium]|nr:hypothetical protein [Verrucomicrobiales bacterium]